MDDLEDLRFGSRSLATIWLSSRLNLTNRFELGLVWLEPCLTGSIRSRIIDRDKVGVGNNSAQFKIELD